MCATHLKGQGEGFAIYAAQYNDLLPSMGAGTWLHDLANPVVDALVNAAESTNLDNMDVNSIRKWFYCPGNPQGNNDTAWDTYGSQAAASGWRGTNYGYLYQRTFPYGVQNTGVGTDPGLARRSGKTPPIKEYPKMSLASYASSAELAFDEICSHDETGTGFDVQLPKAESTFQEVSNHLRGTLPLGQNVLTFDSAVTWRNFPSNPGSNNNVTPIPQSANNLDPMWLVNP